MYGSHMDQKCDTKAVGNTVPPASCSINLLGDCRVQIKAFLSAIVYFLAVRLSTLGNRHLKRCVIA